LKFILNQAELLLAFFFSSCFRGAGNQRCETHALLLSYIPSPESPLSVTTWDTNVLYYSLTPVTSFLEFSRLAKCNKKDKNSILVA
jgi:hypothetical protein